MPDITGPRDRPRSTSAMMPKSDARTHTKSKTFQLSLKYVQRSTNSFVEASHRKTKAKR